MGVRVVPLPRGQRALTGEHEELQETGKQKDEENVESVRNPGLIPDAAIFRGLLYGLPISLLLWALILFLSC